jgi:monofunctional biosynthetic peptidoglycan transglycosylase
MTTTQPTVSAERASDKGGNVETIVAHFDEGTKPWRNVDDVVMGGVSSSKMQIVDGIAIFSGKLSLENNGGFASVRSQPLKTKLDGCNGIRLRVKGDGRTYQFRIRTNTAFDGASYRLSFDTKEAVWTEHELPFSDFEAAYRGRLLPDHPPIDPARIETVGLLLADKKPGPFEMHIDWIKAYTHGDDS